MTQQHTPGPWFASKDGWSNGTVTHNLPTGHIGQICHVQCTGAKTQSEGNSNARLIAAAPELLAALQAFYDAESELFSANPLRKEAQPDNPIQKAWLLAGKAISKALNG